MKTISAMAALTLAFLPASLFADGKDNSGWAEEAAKKYEQKAEWAEKEGMPRAASIYRRMAEIKREAGRASKHGKKYDWSEYHKLEGQLNHIKAERGKDTKHAKHGGDKHAGEGFLKAAEEYREQARNARKHGDSDNARIYMQLAEHKVAAAKAAKAGEGYDWTAYHELRKKLNGGNDHKGHDKPEHQEHDKPVAAKKLNIE